MNKPLLVLDTNVVLDLLHFDDVATRPLLHALQTGQMRCAVSDATFEEWQRVLAYPEFALDAGQQAVLAARYHALSTLLQTGELVSGLPHKGTPIHYGLKPGWSRMPRCSDPDDQKFVELAAASGAQALISKDHAVLKLRRRCAPLFRVVTPVEALGWLEMVLP